MLSQVDADLGVLFAEFSEDPESLQAVVIDEIERSLPQIISNLRIPPRSDMRYTQLLEFRLAGKPGFRRLNSGERETAIKRLENEKFLATLRKAQEAFSNGILAGTAKRAQIFVSDSSERSRVIADSAWDIVPNRATPILETFSQVNSGPTDMIVAPAGSHALQGELPFDVAEAVSSKTVQVEEDVLENIIEVPDIPIELQEPLLGRDIRDLLAIIKGDKLVSFVDASLKHLITGAVKKILVPKERIYANLNLDLLIAKYHDLAVSEEGSEEGDGELLLLDCLIGAMEHEAQWSRINTRRFHLINKKHSIGLRTEEQRELDILDQLAEKQMYAVQDLPFSELAMLKTYSRRLGFVEETD